MNDKYCEIKVGDIIEDGDEKQPANSTKWFPCTDAEIGDRYTNEAVKVRRKINMFKTKENQTAVKEILNILNKAHNTSFNYNSRNQIVKILEKELSYYLAQVMPAEMVQRTIQLFDCEINNRYEILIECMKETEQEQEKKNAEKRIIKMLNVIRDHHHQAANFVDKPGLIKVKSGTNSESDDGWEFIKADWNEIYNWLGY